MNILLCSKLIKNTVKDYREMSEDKSQMSHKSQEVSCPALQKARLSVCYQMRERNRGDRRADAVTGVRASNFAVTNNLRCPQGMHNSLGTSVMPLILFSLVYHSQAGMLGYFREILGTKDHSLGWNFQDCLSL